MRAPLARDAVTTQAAPPVTATAPVATAAAPAVGARLTALDALRGLVMVIMALDHTRDFIHAGAMIFSPENLTQTTTILFLTRWITHICAPVFMFSAGAGAFLRLQRPGTTRADLSWFLWTRGLWLVIVDLTIMRWSMNFTVSMNYPVLLVVLWALGLSMIALAALIHLPMRGLATLSLAIIVLHNGLDGFVVTRTDALAGLWRVLHQQGLFVLAGIPFVVAYPVLPWIGVMAAGFCAGTIFLRPAEERQRLLIRWGLAMIAGFVILRALNVYGDPQPWSVQSSATFTVLSFLRATKYPPSAQFLLMTLGPAFLLLAYFDRRGAQAPQPLVVLGRVPLFFFVAHFWLLHVIEAVLAWVKYGSGSFAYLLMPVPSMGGPRDVFPPGFGHPLWVVYVVWIGTVLLLYPLCRWFAALRARRRDWWLSYL